MTPGPSNSAMHCRRISARLLNLLNSIKKASFLSLFDWVLKPNCWNQIDIKASLISLID
jgi:hypothetical protein